MSDKISSVVCPICDQTFSAATIQVREFQREVNEIFHSKIFQVMILLSFQKNIREISKKSAGKNLDFKFFLRLPMILFDEIENSLIYCIWFL